MKMHFKGEILVCMSKSWSSAADEEVPLFKTGAATVW